jgi:hypothetical protein
MKGDVFFVSVHLTLEDVSVGVSTVLFLRTYFPFGRYNFFILASDLLL